MTTPPPPEAITDRQLAERVAQLQSRRRSVTSAPATDAPARVDATAARRPPRRRHPAAGARAGALLLTVATTGGLGALLATLGNAQATTQTLAGLPAPILTTPSTAGSAAAPSARATATPGAVEAFNGSLINTRYGPVQVQAQISNGTISEVAVVAYPDGDGESRSINARALPRLRTEVLTAQDANVDTVSGATYTSNGYRESLQAALDQARAAGVSIA